MKTLQRVLAGTLVFVWPQLALAHDGPDGKITHRHNEVKAQPDGTAEWREAEVGDLIYKQGRVNTLEASTAAVLMRDQGSVAMRANTLLIIYGHHALRDKKIIAMEAELERGALRSRLGELEGGSTSEVTTPGAETTMTGGNSLIKVDDEGTSRIHNHGEGETNVQAKRGGKTKVKRGMGVKVEKKKRARKPIPLPPTPGWAGGTQVFLGVSGQISELSGAWAAVPEAETYYVEVARDAEGIDVISAIEVPKSVAGFEVHGLPAGSYHVRVASVDDDQFESIPSDAYSVELVDVGLAGPGGVGPFWPTDGGLTPVPLVLPGTALELPAGIRCGPSADALEARPLFIEAGTHELVCERDDGATVAAFPVEVPALGAQVEDGEDAAAPAPSATLELPRGVEVTRELRFDTDLELPPTLYLMPPEGIEVVRVEPGAEPGSWSLTLIADETVPADAEIGLSFVDPASIEGELPSFASVRVEVVEPPEPSEPPPPPTKPERHMFEFGVAGGLVLLSESHGLFRPSSSSHQPFNRPAGEVVLRAGYYPLRWVGIELDGRLIPTRVANDERALAYSIRAQVLGQLPYRVTPYLALGGEMLGVRSDPVALGSDLDFGVHFGGGLKVYITPKLAFRAGVTGMFHEGLGDTRSTHLEVDFGLSVVLGRRSAGRQVKGSAD